MKQFIFLLLSILPFFLFAENIHVDSLLIQLESANDEAKIEIFLELSENLRVDNPDNSIQFGIEAYELADSLNKKQKQIEAAFSVGFGFYLQNNFEEALKYFELSLYLSRELEDNKRIALTLNRIGNSFQLQGKNEKALEYYKEALMINEQGGNRKELARTYTNLGSIYRLYGNYEKAISFHLKSLDFFEGIEDDGGIAWTSLNIARLFKITGDYQKALSYVDKSKILYRKLNDKTGMTLCLKETGSIYHEMNNLDKALEYSKKVLHINENSGNRHGVANSLNNIGEIYYQLGKFELATKYLNESLTLKDSLKDINGKASVLRSLSNIHLKKGSYHAALNFLKSSQKIATEQNLREDIRENHLSFSKIYSGLGDYMKSLKHYVAYSSLKDSLNIRQTTQLEMQFEFDKKQKQLEFEQKQKDLAHEARLQRQKIIIWLFIAGFIFVVVLAFIIYKSYKDKKKANEILAFQNEEILQQKEEIEAQRDEIEAQRDVARQQRDQIIEQTELITDSIQYASRIQNALLPQDKFIDSVLPEHFILYKPKNIVSGDFYWMSQKEKKIIIAAVDCTGHGVPGAFMSMLGVAFLNEIVNKNQIIQADKILEELRKNVIDSLHQTTEIGSTKDGMDIALCIIDREKGLLQYAGAHNPLYIIHKKELIEIKADKMPIGIYAKNTTTPFTNHELKIFKDDYIYMFSDGFIDQFGGKEGNKFRSSNFKKLLLENCSKPMAEQKVILEKAYLDWKGKRKQLDDILVMGVKV